MTIYKAIPDLPPADAASALDLLEISQAGVSRRATVAQLVVLAGTVNVRSFGAVGDGVADDTAALNDAFAAAVGALLLVPPGTYKFTSLSIPGNVTMTAIGAVFRSSGTFNNIAVSSIDVGANCTIDELTYYSSPAGTEIHRSAVYLGPGVKIGYLRLKADVAMQGEGCWTLGQDVEIGFLYSLRFDRPFSVNNTSGAQTTGFKLGGAYVNTFVRAIYLRDTAGFSIGPTHIEVGSPNAAVLPGHNGFLIAGCQNGNIDNVYISDTGEHGFRIGGSPVIGRSTKNLAIGELMLVRTGGCALKINPTLQVSSGVTETADNISIAGVRGIDVGRNPPGNNCELLRISHVRKCTIGWAFADIDQYPVSCQYALRGNDIDGLWIGSLGARQPNGVVSFDQTSDSDGITLFGGNVTNVHIGELFGDPGNGNLISLAMSNFIAGNIIVSGIDVPSVTTNLLSVSGAQVFNGPLHVAGRVGGSNTPLFAGTANSQITYNIAWGDARIIGNPTFARYSSRQEIAGDVVNIANVLPVEPFVSAINGVSALNAYGPGMSFGRIGSARRGGGLAVKQTGASQSNTGLALFVGTSSTATDALIEAATFDHFMALKLNGALLTGAPVTKTANFTVGSTENDIIVNNPSSITTVTLPAASAWTGWKISITNYSAAFTVISASANIVPKTGAAAGTAILPATAGAWIELKSDGANWITLRSGT